MRVAHLKGGLLRLKAAIKRLREVLDGQGGRSSSSSVAAAAAARRPFWLDGPGRPVAGGEPHDHLGVWWVLDTC